MAGGGSAADLDRWLAPFLEVMGRKTRRSWAPLYLRGLLGHGERKSLQPMAARLGLSGHDQLRHFIASPAWDDAPLWRVLAATADRLVGGPDAVLVIDDTALPKKGELSVGVARQYCGQLGKRANCQALVSLTLARGEVPLPLALRLFLPEEWTADPARCARAGVPAAEVVARSKGEIALAHLDRLLAAKVRFGTVLADAGYGASADDFRHGLDRRGLRWAPLMPRLRGPKAISSRTVGLNICSSGFWKANPTCRASRPTGWPLAGWPPMVTCPLDGRSRPIRCLASVVLPAPLSPVSATSCPVGIARLMSRSTGRSGWYAKQSPSS